MHQHFHSPLTNVDNVVLSGNVSTRNGTGDGSVGAAWRRTTSDRNWFEVDAKLGSNSSTTATYFRRLTSKTFVNMSGQKLYSVYRVQTNQINAFNVSLPLPSALRTSYVYVIWLLSQFLL